MRIGWTRGGWLDCEFPRTQRSHEKYPCEEKKLSSREFEEVFFRSVCR